MSKMAWTIKTFGPTGDTPPQPIIRGYAHGWVIESCLDWISEFIKGDDIVDLTYTDVLDLFGCVVAEPEALDGLVGLEIINKHYDLILESH